MRYGLFVLWMLFWSATSAMAQVSIGIGLPGVNIGINLPFYPNLVQVPGYPVYYAPRLNSNFFFYDGMYWVYEEDRWYASTWYNGPWRQVTPEYVPLYVLRIPVRYYRNPPMYFRNWQASSPPRWNEHWGDEWAQHRSGWDRWNHRSAPKAAPLPVYQKQYSADRYPRVEQQQAIQKRNYRYQPRDAMVRQHAPERSPERAMHTAPVPSRQSQQGAREERMPMQQEHQRSNPPPSAPQISPAGSRSFPQQRGDDMMQRPTQNSPRSTGREGREQAAPPQQGVAPNEQRAPAVQENNRQQSRGEPRESRREQGQERGQDRGQERGQERGLERNR